MNIGNRVITHEEERGIIVRPWNRDDGQYNWWVDIHFIADGTNYTSTIPYKESELKYDYNTYQ